MKFAPPPCGILLVLLACGCSSSRGGPVETMSCAELNSVVASTSKDVSATAIGRSRVENFATPFRVPGVDLAKDVLVGRADARIEQSRMEQEKALAARRDRCPNEGI